MAITDAACEALGLRREMAHNAIEALHDF